MENRIWPFLKKTMPTTSHISCGELDRVRCGRVTELGPTRLNGERGLLSQHEKSNKQGSRGDVRLYQISLVEAWHRTYSPLTIMKHRSGLYSHGDDIWEPTGEMPALLCDLHSFVLLLRRMCGVDDILTESHKNRFCCLALSVSGGSSNVII